MNYYNGASYTGNWVKGKQQGKGKYCFPNKNFYEGDWESGKMHGRGVLIKANGQKK
jgi:hypothetical protein